MTVNATITITRDDEELEVTITANTEWIGSADPYERGERVSDWVDVSPPIKLTQDEIRRADALLDKEVS